MARYKTLLTEACAVILLFAVSAAQCGEVVFDQTDFDWLSPVTAPKEDSNLLTIAIIPGVDRIVPGSTFTVAVRLLHKPGSYTYWTNPGGPGKSSDFLWTLPEGFTVGPPQLPAPSSSMSFDFVSYVYKGEKYVLFDITPPSELKDGENIPISLEVDTQVCTPRSCIPTKLSAKAQILTGKTPADENPLIAKIRDEMPIAPLGWSISAEKTAAGFNVILVPKENANETPGDIYFFDQAKPSPSVDTQAPQKLAKADGGWRLSLAPIPDREAPTELSGILTSSKGWLNDDASLRAFQVALPLQQSLGPVAPTAAYSDGVLLLFAFLGGLLLNIMPCVFPVLSIKIMSFVRYSHSDKRSVLLHGLAYCAGVLICFWILAIIVITLGRGWGAQLQSPLFVTVLCYFFMAFALNMAGVFEIGESASALGGMVPHNQGLRSSFYTGLLTTVVATPCSAPFLGPALAYSLSLPAITSLGVFTLMGIGLALPYLALSAVPRLLKLLPKPGAWMQAFKQAMSFPLFATSGYMLWTLGGMIDDFPYLVTIIGLTLVAFALWVHGKFQHVGRHASRFRRMGKRFGPVVAALAFAIGVWAGWPGSKQGDSLDWRDWSPELVSELRDEGKPVLVDFTARWCATCQVNKRVYYNDKVISMLRDKGVILLKADWTKNDPRITKTLKEDFGKAAVPVTALYIPGRSQAVLLPDLLTAGNVMTALDWEHTSVSSR